MIMLATFILALLAKLSKEKNIKEFTPSKSFIYTFGAYCGIAARRYLCLESANGDFFSCVSSSKTWKITEKHTGRQTDRQAYR